MELVFVSWRWGVRRRGVCLRSGCCGDRSQGFWDPRRGARAVEELSYAGWRRR